MGGPQNTGIIFWRSAPLQYRLPPVGECSRNPSVSVHQLTLLWEAAFGFSECFLKIQSVFPFYGGWFTSTPSHTVLSFQQFLTKNNMTPPCRTLPIHPISPRVTFFCFSSWKKSFKGSVLPMWKKWNKKWRPVYQLFLLWIMSLVLYLKSHGHTQGHLGFLLCHLRRVLWFCISYLGL